MRRNPPPLIFFKAKPAPQWRHASIRLALAPSPLFAPPSAFSTPFPLLHSFSGPVSPCVFFFDPPGAASRLEDSVIRNIGFCRARVGTRSGGSNRAVRGDEILREETALLRSRS